MSLSPSVPSSWRAIVAMAENRVIGANGKIPWRLPEDLKFFRSKTIGHTVVMGRNTWESLGRPLAERLNVVVSRTLAPGPNTLPGAVVVHSLDEVAGLPPRGEVWIIGGAQLYAAALPRCTELFVSHVSGTPRGNAFFPEFEHDFEPTEMVLETPFFSITRYHRRAHAPGHP